MENNFSKVWIPSDYINNSKFESKPLVEKIARLLAIFIVSILYSVLSLLNHRYLIQSTIPIGLILCLVCAFTISVATKYFASNIGVGIFILTNIVFHTLFTYIYPNSVFIVYSHIEGATIFSDYSSIIYLNCTTLLSFSGFLFKDKK